MTNEKVEYRPSLAAFIDILGFREMLRSSSAQEVYDHLKRLKQSTSPDRYEGLPEDAEISAAICFQVSDAVVRIRHYDTIYRDGALFHELLDLGLAQGELAANGIFIRGGLAAGDAVAGPDSQGPAFGFAVVEAFRTESTVAVFPRIAISQTVLDTYRTDARLKSQHQPAKYDEEAVFELIRSSVSGPWLDYMDVTAGMVDELDHLSFCADHARAIRDRLSQHAGEQRVLEKYLWLAAYHNDHVQRYADDPDGERGRRSEEADGFDGVEAYRETLIEAPKGWVLPDILLA